MNRQETPKNFSLHACSSWCRPSWRKAVFFFLVLLLASLFSTSNLSWIATIFTWPFDIIPSRIIATILELVFLYVIAVILDLIIFEKIVLHKKH